VNRWLSIALVLGCAGMVLAFPWVYRSYTSTAYRNFRVVEPGKLYRSGQMPTHGLEHTIREYGIRTVICLRDTRDDGKPSVETGEAEFCECAGVKHHILTPAKWVSVEGGPVPVEGNVQKFLSIMDDPENHPVLVHCFAGIHRTGGYVGVYRLRYHGWTPEEAIREMKSMGSVRTKFDDEIPSYLRAFPQLNSSPRPPTK
jgi:tyrosine-protein phosphatase SIW14